MQRDSALELERQWSEINKYLKELELYKSKDPASEKQIQMLKESLNEWDIEVW